MLLIEDLKCNQQKNPLGVDCFPPTFSWILKSDENGQKQSAYRILIASSIELLTEGKADLWDSGKIESDETLYIQYKGSSLSSRKRYFWKVAVWDKNLNFCSWSDVVYFETGMLSEKEWVGNWIGAKEFSDVNTQIPAPLLRKKFSAVKRIKSARVYICGLGYYELYINGKKVGNQVLSPSVSHYDKTLYYDTFDVTSLINEGENAVGVILGNGWYNSFTQTVWNFHYAAWKSEPKLLFQMCLTFDDGSEYTIKSDSSWKTEKSPIVFDSLRNGEYYDARLEVDGWDKVDFDDSNWKYVTIKKNPGGKLICSAMPPIKVNSTIKPVSVREIKPQVWVFDLGQNMSGWARIKVSGDKGTQITLKYAEKLNKDGSIDIQEISKFTKSGEFQTDGYILKGEGVEVWEPRFTYHGFQYIEMSGYNRTPDLEMVEGRVVHTALDTIGKFECSNELLNKIQSCARWSTLTNYHGIPTDCPHREKNGWTGDVLLSAEQMILNFDISNSLKKFLRDIVDVQRHSGQIPTIAPTGGWGYSLSGPAWDSILVLVPWYLYIYSGDKKFLEEMYVPIKKYVDFLQTMADGYIINFGLGDWCPPNGNGWNHSCPVEVTATAYYYVDALTLSKIAALLGKSEDKEFYENLAKNIRKSFYENYIDVENLTVKGNCQTSTACALYQGVAFEEDKKELVDKLVEQVVEKSMHLDCGILGTKYVLNTLTDNDRTDIAYDIATKKDFPSWGHWIEQGATTLWEHWDGTGSLNHHMFSDISGWFYKGLAGINPDPENPGFKNIIIKPNPVGDLRWVKASYKCPYGLIECNWRKENNGFIIELNIPVNCTATIYLPEEVVYVEAGYTVLSR